MMVEISIWAAIVLAFLVGLIAGAAGVMAIQIWTLTRGDE